MSRNIEAITKKKKRGHIFKNPLFYTYMLVWWSAEASDSRSRLLKKYDRRKLKRGVYYSSQAEVVRLEGVTGRSREVTGLEAKWEEFN